MIFPYLNKYINNLNSVFSKKMIALLLFVINYFIYFTFLFYFIFTSIIFIYQYKFNVKFHNDVIFIISITIFIFTCVFQLFESWNFYLRSKRVDSQINAIEECHEEDEDTNSLYKYMFKYKYNNIEYSNYYKARINDKRIGDIKYIYLDSKHPEIISMQSILIPKNEVMFSIALFILFICIYLSPISYNLNRNV